jgi:PAS domain S-box-containing protein
MLNGAPTKSFTINYRLVDQEGESVWVKDKVKISRLGNDETRLTGVLTNLSAPMSDSEKKRSVTNRLPEGIKELNCLHHITTLDESQITVDQLLSQALEIIPSGFKYPSAVGAAIFHEKKTFKTEDFQKKDWILQDSINKEVSGSLSITVCYQESQEDEDIGPFLLDEKRLLRSILESLSLKISRIYSKIGLKERQRLLKKTQRLTSLGSWHLDYSRSTLTWSGEFQEYGHVGYVDNPVHQMCKLFKKGEHRKKMHSLLNRALERGASFDTETIFKVPGHPEVWVRVIGDPEFENGKCLKIIGTTQNIDKRKRAELALKMNEKRMSSLLRYGSDLIAVLNEEGNYIYAAPSSKRDTLFGLKANELIGMSWFSFVEEHKKNHLLNILKSLGPGQRVDLNPYRYQDIKGNWRWMESTVVNLTKNPAIQGYLFNSRDVTDRIDKERKLTDIVEHTTNLFYKHDTNHNLLYVSPQSKEFFGLDPEEAMKKWTDLITDHPKNRIGLIKTVKAIQSGEAQEPYEIQLRRADGQLVWARVHEAPVVENGETVSIVGSLTDITEQKQSEQRLKDLSLVASKTTDLIIISNAEDKITWVNDAFVEKTGYTLDECIGHTAAEILRGPGTNSETVERINKLTSLKKSFHATLLNFTKQGEPYWSEMTVDPILEKNNEFKGFISINRDVTDKINREKKLNESIQRYAAVSKATSDVIWEMDLVEDSILYNENIYRLFGYRIESVKNVRDWWKKNIHPEDREKVLVNLRKYLNTDSDRIQMEYRFRSADGDFKHVLDRAYIIRDEQGKPVRLIGAMQDVTREKKEKLWLKLMQSAVKNTSESIVILEGEPSDLPGRKILYANQAFEEMTGYKAQQVIGSTLGFLNGSETSEEVRERIRESMSCSKPYETEIINYRNNGKKFWAHVSYAPVLNRDGRCSHWIVVGHDVTNKKRRVQALKESLKEKETLLMEIHHRVKNNLAVVSSMMQLQALQDTDESLQKKLYDSVSRIRTMVTIHEMLYESHSFSNIDLCKNIRKLVSTILNTIPANAEIKADYDCDELFLNVNQAIPVSLIVNEVLTNAVKHAFKNRDKGKIDVSLIEYKNGKILLAIKDDGIGLPAEIEEKNNKTLGFQLVDVLSDQIQGEYKYLNSKKGGVEFRLSFQKNSVNGIGNIFMQ